MDLLLPVILAVLGLSKVADIPVTVKINLFMGDLFVV